MEEKWISIFTALFSGKATSSTYSLLFVGLVGLLWAAFQRYASTGQPFSLPTPSEHRIKAKLATLKNEIADTTDPEVQSVLASDVARLQFMLARSSDFEAVQRNELLGVHKYASAQIVWRQVHAAAPYFRYETDRVVEGIHRVYKIAGWYFLLSGIAEIIVALFLLFWAPNQIGNVFLIKLLFTAILALPFVLLGVVSLRFAQPIWEAHRLQGAVRRWRASQDCTQPVLPLQAAPSIASTTESLPVVITSGD